MKIQTKLVWFLLFGFLHLFSGCNYYRISKTEPVSEAKLRSIPDYKRFLVYQRNNVWELKNVQVKEQVLEGTLQAVPDELVAHINPSTTSATRYRSKDKVFALNVVHLHIYENAKLEGNTVIIPFSAIKQLYTPVKDWAAITASHVFAPIGAAVVAYRLWVIFRFMLWVGRH